MAHANDSAVTKSLQLKQDASRALKEMTQCVLEGRMNDAYSQYYTLYLLAEDIDLPLMNPLQSKCFCALEALRSAMMNE